MISERRFSLLIGLAGCVLALVMIGCGAFTKSEAKSAIDAALAACIVENPGVDETALHTLCHWADAFGPEVQQLLQSERKGLAKVGVTRPAASSSFWKAD